MDNVLNFLSENYLYFMIGAVVLLFALIGFAVDGRKKSKEKDVEMNPTGGMPNQPMQFGQNPNPAPTNQTPNPAVQNNGMSTGFDQFATQPSSQPEAPTPEVPTPAEVPASQSVEPNKNEEGLTFGPIAANTGDTIFTEPPVVENSNNDTLTFEMPNAEPQMEALDLGTPQPTQTQPNDVPVSMMPETPTQNEVPAPVVPEAPKQEEPQMPSLNNTLQ